MEFDKRKSQFHSLALGEAMTAAAEDYKRELLAAEKAPNAAAQHTQIDIDDFLNDPDLEKLHEERLAKLKEHAEKRATMQRQGHGSLEPVAEGDFLEIVTKTPLVVAHFFHQDFERCKIIDKHLQVLASRYFDTRFIRISAPDAPFFVEKLNIRTLPCILSFIDGVAADRIVGFQELGGKDDFSTSTVENRLLQSQVIVQHQRSIDANSEEQQGRKARQSVYNRRMQQKTESDEDSDFSE